MRRRELLKALTAAAVAGVAPRLSRAAEGDELYDIGKFGDVRVLHMTDTHAQLEPVYFREPSVNLGIGPMAGHPPHLVGEAFLKAFGIAPRSRVAHAFTCSSYNQHPSPRTMRG
jgi:sulfur-oxidizing protein SoxB